MAAVLCHTRCRGELALLEALTAALGVQLPLLLSSELSPGAWQLYQETLEWGSALYSSFGAAEPTFSILLSSWGSASTVDRLSFVSVSCFPNLLLSWTQMWHLPSPTFQLKWSLKAAVEFDLPSFIYLLLLSVSMSEATPPGAVWHTE